MSTHPFPLDTSENSFTPQSTTPPTIQGSQGLSINSSFRPRPPKTLDETGLNSVLLEDLIYKVLLSRGVLSGRDIAQVMCLPFTIVEPILHELKSRLLVNHKSTCGVGDFLYTLTEEGQARALMAREASAYVGSAPVVYDDYLIAVSEQTIRSEQPGEAQLKHAFDDLLLPPELFLSLGPAINSGRGLFLFGEPGNGKTSIAERICQCFGDAVYIPKTLIIHGQLVQLFDPQCHEEISQDFAPLVPQVDQRWVYIKRPVVMAGGELTLENLELKYNDRLKISEAPLQMKANCGVFLIDDFGRQLVPHDALLNRWIVPLEKRIDYLTLPNGQKIEVPFDELIIFSTNLDPADLVDDAFLRRIPYKINVGDPSEAQFKAIMTFMAPRYHIDFDENAFRYLVETHYHSQRPFRACQARDLLEQIVNQAKYLKTQPQMTPDTFDAACFTYFAAMGKGQHPY